MSSGLGFVIGHCETNVYSDAARNAEAGVVVDFLNGSVFANDISENLQRALPLYRDGFPLFCLRHNIESSEFLMFRTRFLTGQLGNSYIVTIEDTDMKCSSIEYKGNPGRRVKQLDDRGRIRPNVLQNPDALTLAFE